MAQVSYGTITITDTNDIKRIYVEYCRSTSNQLSGDTVPNITREWGETTPEWVDKQYIWQRTVVEKSGTPATKVYGKPVCVTGAQGSQGTAGRSLKSTKTEYTTAANNVTISESNMGSYTWSSNVPTYSAATPAYWTRITNVYENPNSTVYVFYKDNGITEAVKTSHDANETANAAEEKADAADGKADEALELAKNTNYAWWSLPVAKTVGTNTFAAGSYGTFIKSEDFQNNPTNQPNIFVDANGLHIRTGLSNLASFTGTQLSFYSPSNSSIPLMGLTASGLAFYNSAGAELGKFGSTGLDMSGTLNIKGGGRIGQDSANYWEFGDNAGYNVSQAAYLLGKGNASIQLGENGHWRIDKNRIHTGWYVKGDSSSSTPAGSLHFDTYDANRTSTSSGDQYYWDYGLHFPVSNTTPSNNKFLYVRRSNTTVATTTLAQMKNRIDNDDYWDYQFYIDDLGNVHAPGFYIGNSTTPIGGGAGTIAQKIINSDNTYGKGSSIKPIYIDTSGYVQESNSTVGSGTKPIYLSSGTITASNSNVGNSTTPIYMAGGTLTALGYTIAKSVPSNAVFTDENVNTSQANTTKIYLTGTSTTGSTTGKLNFDSNVYLTTTTGTLHATTFEGNLSGTASRATADADGNTIKTTYLKLSGGQVTGPVSFGDSVTMDEATVGDLIVNGNASFTNNISANTINGVSVGSNPKFTDTTYTFASGTNGFTVTPSGGSAQTVTVTPSITNNVTGSGTSGSLVKWTGTNIVGNGPALGSDTTKFLNNKGEWAVPAGTYTYTLPLAANGTRGGVQIGYTANGKNYPVQLSSEKMYVNVPWENTTYESKTAVSGGTDVSLVTTGEKYTWNQKTSNTGTVTSVATSSPITGGTITGSGTIGHATSGVGSATTTAGLYKFKYDTYGHVTGVTAIAKADITGLGIPAQDTTYSNASTTTAGLMSAADKKKLDNIQVDSSGQAVAANVAGRWGIDVTFSDTNVAQVGHANTAVTASNTQASTVSSATTKTALSFGSIVKLPYVSYDTYGHVTGKSEVYFQLPAAPSSTTSATNATNDSDGNPINTTYIKKSIGTAAGDIIYWSASGTPVRLAKGSNGQVLKLANGVPTWGADNNDNTNYYHTTGSWSGLTYTATANGGAGALAFTLPTASASASGVINTDAQVIYGKKTLKNTTRIYPRIGASAERSQWYKITFPYSTAETTNAAKWFMNSFDLHFGGGYSSNANGVAHVAFYWTRAANNGVWAASQVSAKLDGVLMNKISLYYRIAEPGVLYVNNSSNNYNGLWLDNLFVDDSSPALDWSTTTITSCSSITIGDYIEVPTVRTYNNDNSTYIIGNHTLPMSDNTYNLGSSDLKWRNVYATTFNGNASTASKITNITSADTASSSENWRKVWISYSDGVTGRPAVTDGLTFQTSTNTLKATTFSGALSGNASTATKWASAQTVYVTLGTASTSTTIQGGSSSAQTIGVNGTLAIGNGGTGLTASPSMLTNLGSTTAANVLQASPRPGITGTLGIANGGTGQTTATNAINALLGGLPVWTANPTDTTYFIRQDTGGAASYGKVAFSTIWNYINGKANDNYVTINTPQTITASQKTFNGAIRWGDDSKYGAAHYDSTLEAIVFSFA